MTKVFDVVTLNVLWLVGCIPIVTIGASTTALYYMIMKMVRDEEEGIFWGFWHSFKENLRQSIPITLLFLGLSGILAADFHILGNSKEETASVAYGVCVTLLILEGAVLGYVFPLLARFENTTKNTLVNAAKIAASHLPQTACILTVNFLPFIWLVASPETFSRIFWLWFFAGTGASAWLNSLLLVRIFDSISGTK